MHYMAGARENKKYVVECKRCRRDIPAGVTAFPFQAITVGCPLCGEVRQYLPSEVALGNLHYLVTRQLRSPSRNRRPNG